MGKYILWISAVIILAPILWIACVGLENKTIVSPDSRHTIMISSSWRGTYVHLFNRYWWE